MNNNLLNIHPNLVRTKCRWIFLQNVRTKCKSDVFWVPTIFVDIVTGFKPTKHYFCTQWAAVITITGSQLRRRAPQPSQELSALRMATFNQNKFICNYLRSKYTCHGISLLEVVLPPTTRNGFPPFFTIRPFLKPTFLISLTIFLPRLPHLSVFSNLL